MKCKMNFKNKQGLTIYLIFVSMGLFTQLFIMAACPVHWIIQVSLLSLIFVAPLGTGYRQTRFVLGKYLNRQQLYRKYRDNHGPPGLDYCCICGCSTGNDVKVYKEHINKHLDSGPKQLRRRLWEIVINRKVTTKDIVICTLLGIFNLINLGFIVALNWFPIDFLCRLF